ncbi:MAG: hypothetical protein ACHRHE_11030 [Tepidisphaerales bacterium]
MLSLFAWADVQSDDRTLVTIDFEERALGNPEETPMYWSKVEGPGLPHYLSGVLATDRAHSGQSSFRFDINGGSLIYRYQPGRVRVPPGTHYRVETYVQTTPLKHARARLTAYFVDVDLRPITSSIRHSDPYGATRENEPWKRLWVDLSADPRAASLAVELELLQPELFGNTTLGQQAIFPQDIRGSAWFDDVAISQVPKITVATEQPGNIFPQGKAVSLVVCINDRSTNDLASQLVVRDAAGRVVWQKTGSIDIAAAETLASGSRQMHLPVPELRCGWYEATLTLSSHGRHVGQRTTNVIILADRAEGIRPDPRFGVDAAALPFKSWGQLPDLLPMLGTGRVKLAVWSGQTDFEQANAVAFDQLLVRLQERGITPTACLVDVPPSISRNIGGSTWRQMLEAPRETWQPQFAVMISRHANHLDRWQLGVDGSDAFVTDPSMRKVYDTLFAEFTKLVQHPDLAMPWPAWHELDGNLPATVALSVPPSVLPSQIPLYMQDIRRHSNHNLSLYLQLLDRTRYSREVQICDLAQRTIYALAAGATRIDFPLPFSVDSADQDLSGAQPLELLLVTRTLATTLAGATFLGRMPVAEGVEAFLFERNGQSILAMWDKGPSSTIKQLSLTLGESPRSVDLWGNSTPLVRPLDNGKPSQKVQLEVGPMPFFLVDIDGPLAQLRASLSVDRPLLESTFRPHTRKIRFTNPYRTALSGMLRFKAPPGWTVTPPIMQFNANPDETFEREFTIEFPYNSFAGPKTLDVEFAMQDNRISSTVVPVTLHLGLSEVGMQTLAVREGKDVLVQQIITNYGDKPIDYTAFGIFPGQPRDERLIFNLAPGKSALKLYRFPAPRQDRLKVRVGVKEMAGSRILNDEVEVQ